MAKKPENPKLDELLHLLSLGNSHEDCATLTGYKQETVRQYASRYRERIQDLAVDGLRNMTPLAIKRLGELLHSDSDAVSLKAVNRVLEANDLGVVHKSEIRHKSDEDLNQLLLDSVGGDPTKVEEMLAILRNDDVPTIQ